jgi:hypothetical protein
MSTPVSDFRDPIRFLLGDNSTPSEYSDAALDRGVRTFIRGNGAPDYALTPDNLSITPDPTAQDYMLISAKTALLFNASRPRSYSFATRGYKQSAGGIGENLNFELHRLIAETEAGSLFDGWQSLASWLEGMSGVRQAWAHLTRVEVDAPFNTATISESGVSVD